MKHCTYCGQQFPDEATICPVDQQPLQALGETSTAHIAATKIPARDEISSEERRFWERMTFRQFAIVMVRLQALWFFFYAVVNLVYSTRYLLLLMRMSGTASPPLFEKLEAFGYLLRALLHFAAGVFLVQKADKVLSWLVKDYVAESTAKRPESIGETPK